MWRRRRESNPCTRFCSLLRSVRLRPRAFGIRAQWRARFGPSVGVGTGRWYQQTGSVEEFGRVHLCAILNVYVGGLSSPVWLAVPPAFDRLDARSKLLRNLDPIRRPVLVLYPGPSRHLGIKPVADSVDRCPHPMRGIAGFEGLGQRRLTDPQDAADLAGYPCPLKVSAYFLPNGEARSLGSYGSALRVDELPRGQSTGARRTRCLVPG